MTTSVSAPKIETKTDVKIEPAVRDEKEPSIESVHSMLIRLIKQQKEKEEKQDIWKNSPYKDLVKLQSNNVGSIGEELINNICKASRIDADCNGDKTKKIGGGQGDGKIMDIPVEIKTAHRGSSSPSFQHELGEEPWKGGKYMIFVDIAPECIYLTIFKNFVETIYKSKAKLPCFPTKTITWRKGKGAFKLDTSVKINEQSVRSGHAIKIMPTTSNDSIASFIQETLLKTDENMVKMKSTTTTNVQLHKMDYTTKTREELIIICKEKKIKGYSGKKKDDIVRLIQEREPKQMETLEEEVVATNTTKRSTNLDSTNLDSTNLDSTNLDSTNLDTNLGLLEKCLEQVSMKEIADKLSLCVGTIRRWLELKDVPTQYTFDLHKLLARKVDYSQYTSSQKDQFFTPKDVAMKCLDTFRREVQLPTQQYTFIEPSAGDGSFLHILPEGSIGLDIEPRSVGILEQDFLTWKPADASRKYIVFGNPPFGLRGHLALRFINHSHSFADYVCFILPQLFESDGKGSPRKRVRGYNLIYSERLSAVFCDPENQKIKVNGVFQIWSKHSFNPEYAIKSNPEDKMKVYSLSDGGTVASTRNKAMIGKCDVYLPSTCFGRENMRIYRRFEDLPGKKGYGVVFFTKKTEMITKAETIDWSSVSFLSTNSALNLRTSIILAQFV